MNFDLNLFRDTRALFQRWETIPGGDSLLNSGWAYLTLWRTECLGRVTIDKLGYFKIAALFRWKLVLRELISVCLAKAPVLCTNNTLPLTRKLLVFSWYLNTPAELTRDRYLGALEQDLDDTVGRIYLSLDDRFGPFTHQIDAYFVFKRTLMWNLWWVIQGALLTSVRVFYTESWRAPWSVERRNAVYMRRQLETWMGRSQAKIEQVLFPYEQHPWQTEIIRFFKETAPATQAVGYIHSSLNNVPAQFVKHRFTPDHLFVHGSAYKRVLGQVLGWDSQNITLIDSKRFSAPIHLEASTIFLPYSFTEPQSILASIQKLVASGVPLKGANIRLHPIKRDAPDHLQLKQQIEDTLTGATASEEINAVTVGVSTVTLETLEAGYKTYAIFEDPYKDALPANLWEELDVMHIDSFCFSYRLKRPKAFISIASNDTTTPSLIRLTKNLTSSRR